MSHTLESLLRIVKYEFNKMQDCRQTGKISYEFSEVLFDNLLLYVQQYGSFRQFKKSYRLAGGIMKEGHNRSQQKSILDKVNSNLFCGIYTRLFNILQRDKVLEKYVYYDNSYLMLMDGSGYYSSNKVKCSKCLIRRDENNIN